MLETGDGEITTFIVTAKENPQFTVMHRRLDTVAGANKTPLMKYHKRDYEAYYVVCGKIRFLAGNENEYTAEATSGTLVVIPPYCSRGYVCLADNTVLLVINYPSGPSEHFIREYSSLRSTSSPSSPPSSLHAYSSTNRQQQIKSSSSSMRGGGVIPSLPDRKRFQSKYGIYINEIYNAESDSKKQANKIKLEKPSMKDLNKDGPFNFGGLCFSHGMIEHDSDDSDTDTTTAISWLYAYDTKNKRPHSLHPYDIKGTDRDDLVLFCIRHAQS